MPTGAQRNLRRKKLTAVRDRRKATAPAVHIEAEREKAKAFDPLNEFPEFPENLKEQAESNAPYYRVLFCLERMIRERVIEVMEKGLGPLWWDTDKIRPETRKEAERLRDRERDKVVTQRSDRRIDYTTLGQLGEIITDNFELFKDHYQSERAVNNAIAELNLGRGPVAHYCALAEEEIVRLKLHVHDWFRLVEKR